MKKNFLKLGIVIICLGIFALIATTILNMFDAIFLQSFLFISLIIILATSIIWLISGVYLIVVSILKRKDKKYDKKFIIAKKITINLLILPIIAIILFFTTYFVFESRCNSTPLAKPVIYIYPEEDMNINVKLINDKNISFSYPKYKDSWNFLAKTNGDLINTSTNRHYYSLYWEGKNYKNSLNNIDGFCVKGEDTISFLEEKLEILGLSERESNEFIVYWLPKMENNKYNYIRFKTNEEIEEYMKLEINPLPKTVIRVSMDFMVLDKYIKLKPQDLTPVERTGFTVVEWGGNEVK